MFTKNSIGQKVYSNTFGIGEITNFVEGKYYPVIVTFEAMPTIQREFDIVGRYTEIENKKFDLQPITQLKQTIKEFHATIKQQTEQTKKLKAELKRLKELNQCLK